MVSPPLPSVNGAQLLGRLKAALTGERSHKESENQKVQDTEQERLFIVDSDGQKKAEIVFNKQRKITAQRMYYAGAKLAGEILFDERGAIQSKTAWRSNGTKAYEESCGAARLPFALMDSTLPPGTPMAEFCLAGYFPKSLTTFQDDGKTKKAEYLLGYNQSVANEYVTSCENCVVVQREYRKDGTQYLEFVLMDDGQVRVVEYGSDGETRVQESDQRIRDLQGSSNRCSSRDVLVGLRADSTNSIEEFERRAAKFPALVAEVRFPVGLQHYAPMKL